MRDFFTVLPTPKTLRANESYNKKGGKTVFRYLFVLPSSSSFMGTTGQDALGEGTRENQRRRRVKGGGRKEEAKPPLMRYIHGGALREDHPHWIGLSSRGRSAFRPFVSSPSGRPRNISSNKLGVMRDPNASSYAEIGREDLLGICRIFGGRRTEGVY